MILVTECSIQTRGNYKISDPRNYIDKLDVECVALGPMAQKSGFMINWCEEVPDLMDTLSADDAQKLLSEIILPL